MLYSFYCDFDYRFSIVRFQTSVIKISIWNNCLFRQRRFGFIDSYWSRFLYDNGLGGPCSFGFLTLFQTGGLRDDRATITTRVIYMNIVISYGVRQQHVYLIYLILATRNLIRDDVFDNRNFFVDKYQLVIIQLYEYMRNIDTYIPVCISIS